MGCCHSSVTAAELPRNPRIQINILPPEEEEQRVSVTKGMLVLHTKQNVTKKYAAERMLGTGGFGIVYLVREKHTGCLFAMKELLKNLLDPSEMSIVEVFETPRAYYIVTEYLSGGELFEVIAKTSCLTESLAAAYTRQLMSALNYLHCNNITHRDLKPENLVLVDSTPGSPLKLIDFGLAATLSNERHLTTHIGEVLYMAPEVFEGIEDVKSDVWSAGAIAAFMLSGKPLFLGPSTKKIIRCILKGKLKLNSDSWAGVSAAAKDLIRSLLVTDPTKRLSAEEALQHPWLNQLVSSEAISRQSLQNLSTFHAGNKLTRALSLFCSGLLRTSAEEALLIKQFEELDLDKDGLLSPEELVQGYQTHKLLIDCDIEDIILNCDAAGNGQISYSEFVTAATQWNKQRLEDRLLHMFERYEAGIHTKFSLSELQAQFPGLQIIDWDQFLREADSDGDKLVSFGELKHYMINKMFE